MTDKKFESIEDVFKNKKQQKKPPAHEWQDLALRIIKDLSVPNYKRSSVFKACKENSKEYIEACLSDTKDLCQSGSKWSYFFKLVSLKDKKED